MFLRSVLKGGQKYLNLSFEIVYFRCIFICMLHGISQCLAYVLCCYVAYSIREAGTAGALCVASGLARSANLPTGLYICLVL